MTALATMSTGAGIFFGAVMLGLSAFFVLFLHHVNEDERERRRQHALAKAEADYMDVIRQTQKVYPLERRRGN